MFDCGISMFRLFYWLRRSYYLEFGDKSVGLVINSFSKIFDTLIQHYYTKPLFEWLNDTHYKVGDSNNRLVKITINYTVFVFI